MSLLGGLTQHTSARVLLALSTAVLAVCPLSLGWLPPGWAGSGLLPAWRFPSFSGPRSRPEDAPVSHSVCSDARTSAGHTPVPREASAWPPGVGQNSCPALLGFVGLKTSPGVLENTCLSESRLPTDQPAVCHQAGCYLCLFLHLWDSLFLQMGTVRAPVFWAMKHSYILSAWQSAWLHKCDVT